MLSRICRGRVYFNVNMLLSVCSSCFKSKEDKKVLIKNFETAFAEYIGVDYAIATPSAKSALYFSLKALDAKKDDEIIVPAYTVREVVDVIIVMGLIPVFVDIDLKDANMNADLVEEKISKKTKFILMTHIHGGLSEVDQILEIAQKHNLVVIEDAAQACGGEYKFKKAGSFGKVACFSFGLLKNLNTLGGGMIVTNEKALAQKIKNESEKYPEIGAFVIFKRALIALVLSCFTHPLFFSLFVYPVMFLSKKMENPWWDNLFKVRKIDFNKLKKQNFRFSAMQAIVGLQQLNKIDKINDERINKAKILNEHLKDCPQALIFKEDNNKKNIYSNFVIRAVNRKKLIDDLFTAGIDVSPGQVICCSDLEDFKQFYSDCPMSRKMEQENIYLPVYHPLDEGHMCRIINVIRRECEKK